VFYVYMGQVLEIKLMMITNILVTLKKTSGKYLNDLYDTRLCGSNTV